MSEFNNSETPMFPKDVYENLPVFLKDCTDMFREDIEKDVFLISAIGVLSGCMPNVAGSYFDRLYFPYSYIFITAPPASGKGIITWSKKLGVVIHDSYVDETNNSIKDYKSKLADYKKKSKKNESHKIICPEEPPMRMLFLPANSSSSMFYKLLYDNLKRKLIPFLNPLNKNGGISAIYFERLLNTKIPL
jgi:hypothetical protein